VVGLCGRISGILKLAEHFIAGKDLRGMDSGKTSAEIDRALKIVFERNWRLVFRVIFQMRTVWHARSVLCNSLFPINLVL
jgi:hypothetical protein